MAFLLEFPLHRQNDCSPENVQPTEVLQPASFVKSRIAHELGSHVIVIPFIFSRDGGNTCYPDPDVSILEILRVHYNSEDIPESSESHSMRCAWFLVALFSRIRQEMQTWEVHHGYRELAQAWKDYFCSHRAQIYEEVRALTIDLISIDPWPTDVLKSQCKKQAKAAAESLISQISRLTGGESSTRRDMKLVISFDDADALEEAEYTMIILSSLFVHLPIMFFHITSRSLLNIECSNEVTPGAFENTLPSSYHDPAFVPLPLDLPSGSLRKSIQEFLSGRRMWRAICHAGINPNENAQSVVGRALSYLRGAAVVVDRYKEMTNLAHLLGLTLVHAEANAMDADLTFAEDTFPHILSLTPESMSIDVEAIPEPEICSRSNWMQLLHDCLSHGVIREPSSQIALRLLLLHAQDYSSTRVLADPFNRSNIPVRVLEYLKILFGERNLSTIRSEFVTELPTIGHVFPNAWIHFTHFIDTASSKSKSYTIGAMVESALVQRAAVVDNHRIFIPVYSASSPERASGNSVLTTSAVIISLGDDGGLTDDLYLESLPELFPHILINIAFNNDDAASVKLGTKRTGASGAFSYEIVARGSYFGIFQALRMEGESMAPLYRILSGE
ncbi:hypothetical protein Moror_14681 [Moniliophthora roreri MCA 2997]|uniref:Uncharacterized protein n=2 Tax=Moniliophthora roreri TaxID=221103 RepID=V2X7I0_MONRO|nr:hypothetical protein Moror_14681 [Moniliophthora roreri MCA 2997]KAI3619663.1 hypothetical protein WG66_002709 [Moniliophthora roreri]